MTENVTGSQVCPCGCGRKMPDPVPQLDIVPYISDWLTRQGITLEAIKGPDRTATMVEVRRRVAVYCRQHGWGFTEIGRLVGRDQSSIRKLLESETTAE